MVLTDIIYATIYKDKPGFCEVTLHDGKTELVSTGIGELFNKLNLVSTRGQYLMIGRSAFICENNIVKICPSKRELVMGYDALGKPHQRLTFSEDLLRKLRSEIT